MQLIIRDLIYRSPLYIFPPGIDTALDSPRLHIVVRTGRNGIGSADVHRTQQMLIPSCRQQHVVVQKHEIVVTGGGNALILTIRVGVVAEVFNHRIGMLPENSRDPSVELLSIIISS